MPYRYFLALPGIAGGGSATEHYGIAVADFDYAMTNAITASPGGGGGSGKPNLGSLELTVDGDVALQALLAALRAGTVYLGATLYGQDDGTGQDRYVFSMANARVIDLHETLPGHYTVRLDYQAASITTQAGPDDLPATYGFSSSTGQQASVPWVDGSAAGTAQEAVTYYLTLQGTGLTGDPGSPYAGGYLLDGFDVDAANTALSGVAAQVVLSQMQLSLASEATAPALFGLIARGLHLQGAHIYGVDAGGNEVYSLALADVQLAQYGNSQSAGQSLTIAYSSLTQATPTGAAVSGTPAVVPELRYFLQVPGLAGDSADPYHYQQFDITGFDFGASSTIVPNGGGGGAGRTDFADVTVRFASLAGMEAMLGHVTAGDTISSVLISGEGSDAGGVYDALRIALFNAVVTGIEDTPGGGFAVTLDYGEVIVAQTASSSDTTSQAFGYSPATNSTTINNATIPAATMTATTGPAPAVPEEAVSYYLVVDSARFTGEAGAPYAGGYLLDDFTASAVRTAGVNSGTLDIGVSGGTDALAFLSLVATGAHVAGAHVYGVSASGEQVYSLDMSDLVVTGYADGSGATTALSLAFGQSSAAIGASGIQVGPGSIAADPVLRYYLEYGATPGAAQDALHGNALNVASWSFAASNPVLPSAGGGGGAGKVDLAPVTIEVSGDAGLQAFLADAVSGRHVSVVTLFGEAGGAPGVPGYDAQVVQLHDVTVAGITETDGGYSVTLNYAMIDAGQRAAPGANGNLFHGNVTGAQFSYTQDAALPVSTPVAVTGPTTAITDYYLSIPSLALPGEDSPPYAGGYHVADFSVTVTGGATSGGGGGAGRVSYGALQVVLDGGETALPALMRTLTRGTHVADLYLYGREADSDKVYVLHLHDVLIGGVADSTGEGGVALTFGYSAIDVSVADGGRTIQGGEGDDLSLIGGDAGDKLFGNGGNDVLEGGLGDDLLDGGAGIDTASYAGATAAVTVRLINGVQNTLGAGRDQLVGIENLTGGAFADTLAGNSASNHIDGGAGADEMRGGKGDDFFVVDNAGDKVIELDGEGSDTVDATVSYSIAGQYIEVLNLLGHDAINGTGNSLNNRIVGNDAANILVGGDGNDRLDGGAGADMLKGGLGNDVYVVDQAGDKIVENNGEGTDTVEASFSYSIAGQYIEILKLMGVGDFSATGNGLANTLYGNSGNNLLNGGAGADTMYGGAGNDTYVVDNIGDRVFENANEGTDTVQSSVTFSIAGQYVENLTLTGTAAINATGNSQANILNGNSAANVLNGGAGNDALHGGLGSDTLIGGSGQDSYWFETTLGAGNVDTISDFNVADDTIYLDRTIFSGIALDGALDPNAFWQGAAAHDADDRIVYDKASGKIWYDADGSGVGAAVLFAQVAANTALTAADFLAVP